MSAVRVALVGCGKAKLAEPAPASMLYTGSLFVAARRYVEAVGFDAWFILSAEHRLLAPGQVVAPYDRSMADLGRDERRSWASSVSVRLRCSHGLGEMADAGEGVELVALAGSAYVEPLADALAHVRGITLSDPMRGLQLGERLHWLATNREAVPA